MEPATAAEQRRLWDPAASKRTRAWMRIREALEQMEDVEIETMPADEWKEKTGCTSGADGVKRIALKWDGATFAQLCEKLQTVLRHEAENEKFCQRIFARNGVVPVEKRKAWGQASVFCFSPRVFNRAFAAEARKREHNRKRASVSMAKMVGGERLTWPRIKHAMETMAAQGKLALSPGVTSVTLLGELRFEAFCSEIVAAVDCVVPVDPFERLRSFFMANSLFPLGVGRRHGMLQAWRESQAFADAGPETSHHRTRFLTWSSVVRALEALAAQPGEKLVLTRSGAAAVQSVVLLGELRFADVCDEIVRLAGCDPVPDAFARVRKLFTVNGLTAQTGGPKPKRSAVTTAWRAGQVFVHSVPAQLMPPQ